MMGQMGAASGVAARLLERYKNVVVWYNIDHRLAPAVSDAVADAAARNRFKTFTESMYALFSQSSKKSA